MGHWKWALEEGKFIMDELDPGQVVGFVTSKIFIHDWNMLAEEWDELMEEFNFLKTAYS